MNRRILARGKKSLRQRWLIACTPRKGTASSTVSPVAGPRQQGQRVAIPILATALAGATESFAAPAGEAALYDSAAVSRNGTAKARGESEIGLGQTARFPLRFASFEPACLAA
jgi:hypothetical protein